MDRQIMKISCGDLSHAIYYWQAQYIHGLISFPKKAHKYTYQTEEDVDALTKLHEKIQGSCDFFCAMLPLGASDRNNDGVRFPE